MDETKDGSLIDQEHPQKAVLKDVQKTQYRQDEAKVGGEANELGATVKVGFKKSNNIREMKIGAIGLVDGKDMLNALDPGADITTATMLRIHVLRIVYLMIVFVYMSVIEVAWSFGDFREYLNQTLYILAKEAQRKAKRTEFSVGVIGRGIESVSYRYQYLKALPNTLVSLVFRYFSPSAPSGFQQFQSTLLVTNESVLPQSTALLLDVNENMIAPIPEIPQPYLDADKKIQVPDKKEVQYVISLKNEYLTQQRAHIAAEKVRLLSEIGRFVTWNSLLPTVRSLTIYERDGCLWNGKIASVSENLEIIATSILNELSSLGNLFKEEERSNLKSTLPKIILHDIATGTRYVVQDGATEDLSDSELIESLISSYSDKREIVVYLSDGRRRNETILEAVTQGLETTELPQDLSLVLPSVPDLILSPSTNQRKPFKPSGFVCFNENEDEFKSAFVYSRRYPFSFDFFVRAIHEYDMMAEKEMGEALVAFEDDYNTLDSSQSVLSYSRLLMFDKLTKLFQRFKETRYFDLKSSRQIDPED